MVSTENSANGKGLVSIICRTIGRPELQQALQSVSSQSYSNIEIVLVDAAAKTLSGYEAYAGNTPVTLISTGQTLRRPEAANAGLQAANGQYLMFLDDDDWIAVDHVQNLVEFLDKQSEIRAVYSSTQKTDSEGVTVNEVFEIDFDPLLLMRDNYIPIHAMLFDRSLLNEGCRFDEAFDIYEDWDFWLQLNQFTRFQHIDARTAFYREGGDFDTTIEDQQIRYKSDHILGIGRAAIFDKWSARWSGDSVNQLLGQMDQFNLVSKLEKRLHQLDVKVEQKNEKNIELRNEIDDLKQELLTTKQHLLQAQTNYSRLLLNHRDLEKGVKDILNSFSWRITKPYRYIGLRLHKYVVGPLLRSSNLGNEIRSPVVADANNFVLEIESPEENSEPVLDELNVRGWAFSSLGLKSMQLEVDGYPYPLPAEAESCLQLLSNCKSEGEAARLGFSFKLKFSDLSPGEHLLTIQAEDRGSNKSTRSQPFIFLDGNSVYQDWLQRCLPSKEIRHAQISESKNLKDPNIVHLLLYSNSSSTMIDDPLMNSIKSLLRQTYQHWRCYLIGGKDSISHQKIESLDPDRIKCVGSSTQEVIDSLTSEGFTGFMEIGETLTDSALWDLIAEKQQESELVYSDHDTLENNGNRNSPVFTFGWSADHLLSSNYVGGLYFVANKFLLSNWSELPVSTTFFENLAWRYELLLYLGDLSTHIQRIPKIFWSKAPLSAEETLALFEDESERVRKYLAQKSIAADIVSDFNSRVRHVVWKLEYLPTVSIIIPTTGNLKYIKPCIDSICSNTEYTNFEIILLDNGRGAHPEGIDYIKSLLDAPISYIECDEAFNWSKLNNTGVEHSKGDLLLFLNDDIEVIDPEWLMELVRQASRADIGVVGSLLLYPNGSIQHAGVFLVDHGGGARHLFHKMVPNSGNYENLDLKLRETSAITGACMMIARDKFVELGQFNEDLPVAGNDIDFCLRAGKFGYRNIWTPHSRLIHHESVSRENTPIEKDEKLMWKLWGDHFERGDFYYNPNLSLLREDCSLRHDRIPPKNIPDLSADHQTNKLPANGDDFGVNLIAYIRAEMGVGEAARGNASALEAAGIPFGILNMEEGNPSKMDNLRWHHKEMLLPKYSVNLIHINADHTPKAIEHLGIDNIEQRYNIGYWAWELPEFPDKWLSSFEYLDEIWVPSTFVNNAISVKSPIPVITIPHAIELASEFHFSKKDLGLPEDRFLFLTMFDTHSISERKNPFGAITAFMRAFKHDDSKVALVIKVNNADQPTLDRLNKTIGDYKNIIILSSHLDRDGVNSLLSNIDCFLSLHRSEGFGLGPAEAMSLGKVALLTNWSGNTQYMTDSNCLKVKYQLRELEKDFGPYQAGQYWAQADYDDAAESMRNLVSNPELVKNIGQNAKDSIQENFSPAAIGLLMKNRLSTIQRTIDSKSTRL